MTTDAPPVEDIEAAVYVLPTDAPEADGTLAWNETTMVLVTARAGGEQGIGWSYAAAAAEAVITGMLAGVVTGRSAFDIAGAAEAMARAVRNVGRGGIAATAISATDIALWDLKARLLGLPVADLLGRTRQHVPVYGSGGFTSYDEQQTREQLSGWVEKDRIPRVKIKIGESWGTEAARDLARVALARQVIGTDAELYVDANGGYTTGQAVRVAERMDEYGVTWFEEPVSSQDLAGLAAVRGQVRPECRGRGVQLVAGRLSAADRRGRGQLPAARRDPLRRDNRVPARRGPGRGAQPAGFRPLRAQPARARRRGSAEPAASRVLP